MENQCAILAFLEPRRQHGTLSTHGLGVVAGDLAIQFVLVRDAVVGLKVEVKH